MLSRGMITNQVVESLQIKAEDRIVSIQENPNADSNFIVSHIVKKVLLDSNSLCLINFHNEIKHYKIIGKKIGYDVNKCDVKFVDVLNDVVDGIYFDDDKESLVKSLFFKIKNNIRDLLNNNLSNHVYVIIDDLSHLHDLNVDLNNTLNFLNNCIDLTNNDKVNVVINNHCSNNFNKIVTNSLRYVADVHIEVSSLKTGRSNDITGVMSVEKLGKISYFHYKAFDRGIKTFHPGEAIYHLYK